MASANEKSVCSLCGQPIPDSKPDFDDALSMDHVPPKQFFPKSVRIADNPNLWKVPTHKRCNNEYKLDEEYFYHCLYPLIANANSQMASAVFQDLRRRAAKAPTRDLIRGLLGTIKTESAGGILLPHGRVQLTVDDNRIKRVAIKIACGVFFHHYQRFMEKGCCKDIRLCESPDDVPEIYALSRQIAEAVAECAGVFSYRIAELDGRRFVSLLFWEAFMFCMVFDESNAPS